MRIVQALGSYLPEAEGGIGWYVASLAAELRARDHEVLIAAPDTIAAPQSDVHDDLPVFRYPVATHLTPDEARGATPVRGTRRFHQWLRDTRADVVHFHTFTAGLGLIEVEVASAFGARVVATAHTARLGFLCERGTMLRDGTALCDGRAEPVKCSSCALQQRGVAVPLARILARVPAAIANAAARAPGPMASALAAPALIRANAESQRRLLESTRAFVVLSQWARKVVVANGAPAAKVVVNRLGVGASVAAWRKPSPDEQPSRLPLTFGFVGRPDSLTGLDNAVRAVRSLPFDAPVVLRVTATAESEAQRAYLHACTRAAAGDARIVFEPQVSREAMGARLTAFDVLLCPSRTVESGPAVALEALAVGTPVVGASVPALSEIVRPDGNGDLHAPGDWRALARILRRIIADPAATLDRWRRSARATRTMADVAADYLSVYGAA